MDGRIVDSKADYRMRKDHAPRAVGERFSLYVGEFDDEEYFRVAIPKSVENSCKECAFYRKRCHLIPTSGSCLPEERPDHRQVVFIKINPKYK